MEERQAEKQLTVWEEKKGVSFLVPQNLQEAIEFSKMIADSDLAPKDYKGKPGNVLVAIQMGAELGLAPMQALQNIAVINGRPCVWGDAALAIVQASGKMEWIKEWSKDGTAYCETKRIGYPQPKTNTFSTEDAQKAQLWGKQGPWTNYADRMKQMRARGFNLRDQFADALKGLNIREEVEDYALIYVEAEQQEDAKLPSPASPPKALEPASDKIPSEYISEGQAKRLFGIANVAKVSNDKLKEYLAKEYEVNSSSEIKAKDYDAIVKWVENGGA